MLKKIIQPCCVVILAHVLTVGLPARTVTKPSVNDPIELAFGWMKGDWVCSGTFPGSGKPIVTDAHIENTLQGSRLLLRQDDRLPNQFHALTFWGWSKSPPRFTSRLWDSVEGDRLFISSGWEGDSLTWNQEPADPKSPQRFIFVRKGDQFGYRFDVQRGGQWVTVDTLDCKH